MNGETEPAASDRLCRGAEEPPLRLPVTAGNWSAQWEDGQLVQIRWRGWEVIRRIYVAVRDPAWGTIAPVVSHPQLTSDGGNWRADFTARHREGPIDFEWEGRIEASDTGALRFTMNGRALSQFLHNRIGFCVLHAAKNCAGRPFEVECPNRSVVAGCFPTDIAQEPVIAGTAAMRSLRYECARDLNVQIGFEGDLFQMEDQRAWTDAAFKSFCTPLELPTPFKLQPGAIVGQAVHVQIEERGAGAVSAPQASEVVRFSIAGKPRCMPWIGLGSSSIIEPLNDFESECLRYLHPAHLRLEIDCEHPKWLVTLRRGCRRAAALDCGVELAVRFGRQIDELLDHLVLALRREQACVDRVLLLSDNGQPLDAEGYAAARTVLQRLDHELQIGCGTAGDYAELAACDLAGWQQDTVCLSMNPQVHAFDDASLMETLEVQGEIIRDAGSLYSGRLICVSPITILPRPSSLKFEPSPMALARQVDPRQAALFGAAWTLGSLKYLCEAGAVSLTYFEATGPCGIVAENSVAPLYHVLADVIEFAGCQVIPTSSSNPLRAISLLLHKNNHTRLLVANLTDRTTAVSIPPFASGGKQTVSLNESSLAIATGHPDAFRQQLDPTLFPTVASDTLTLPPYGVLRINLQA